MTRALAALVLLGTSVMDGSAAAQTKTTTTTTPTKATGSNGIRRTNLGSALPANARGSSSTSSG
jgi:hypothetical protein